ncbi:MAG: DUF2784 domain-containing protein [Thermodesulfobacteriota bacterium]|jgi:hypothetical protein|nr:MAG: DUF2784 domain-containing protein [Thermodesulfobacteriota bacterium]
MLFRVLADFVMALHFVFVLFAVLGGFLALKWKRLAWIHVPAFLWAALIEFAGWICPLTYLETWLLKQNGAHAFQEGFIEHYIFPLIYPQELTRSLQVTLGVFVLTINIIIYGLLILRFYQRKG